MALTTFNPRSFDLSDTYAFTGTVSGTNVGGGSLVKISEQTASASASISFTSGIDSTYRTYYFKFINIHPSNDGVNFQFQGSTDGGSNYNTTMTTTYFDSIHREDDAGGSIQYQAANDLAQSTSYQNLARSTDNDNDSNISGELWLYNPSSTTYVKHFMNRLNHTFNSTPQHTMDTFVAGYFNTTSAINAVDFKMSSGDIDDGTITMYGIA
jgi:hypothetical protein